MKFKGLTILSLILTLIFVISCKDSVKTNNLNKSGFIGIWKLSTWERTDDNSNPDGEIFGVYCDEVHFQSNDSIKFFFRGNLLVAKGTWLLQATEETLLINLERKDSFSWRILNMQNTELTFEEQTLGLITNEQVNIFYTLNKQ